MVGIVSIFKIAIDACCLVLKIVLSSLEVPLESLDYVKEY